MGAVPAWSRALAALCLVALLACSAPPQSLAQSAASDEAFWQTVKSSGERDLLEAFIAAFPQSKYVAEARAAIAALKPASPARPPASSPVQAFGGTWANSADKRSVWQIAQAGNVASIAGKFQGSAGHTDIWSANCQSTGSHTMDCRGQGTFGDAGKQVPYTFVMKLTINGETLTSQHEYTDTQMQPKKGGSTLTRTGLW